MPPNFAEKTFADGSKTSKSAKVNFLLYGIIFLDEICRTNHLLVELHDLGSSLGNSILVTSNSDIILIEGGRGYVDTSPRRISDGFDHRVVGAGYEGMILLFNLKTFKSQLSLK